VSRLHNPKATLWSDTRRLKRYFHVVYGVAEEPMERNSDQTKGQKRKTEAHSFGYLLFLAFYFFVSSFTSIVYLNIQVRRKR